MKPKPHAQQLGRAKKKPAEEPAKNQTPLLFLGPDEAAAQALDRAIEYAKGYGRMTAIADTMTLATGSCVSRQMVGRWLNPDPLKRVQTNLGTGLMLLHVVHTLSESLEPTGIDWRPRESVHLDVDLFRPEPKPKNKAKK